MAREYRIGDRVILSAAVKRCNPDKRMVVLVFPDGNETEPMTWEFLEDLETDAHSMIYVPHDTIPEAPLANGD